MLHHLVITTSATPRNFQEITQSDSQLNVKLDFASLNRKSLTTAEAPLRLEYTKLKISLIKDGRRR